MSQDNNKTQRKTAAPQGNANNRTRTYTAPSGSRRPVRPAAKKAEPRPGKPFQKSSRRAHPTTQAATKPKHRNQPRSGQKPSGGRPGPKRTGGSQRRRPMRKNSPPRSLREKDSGPNDQLKKIPALKKGDLRIITVCGVEWIGTNMTAVEYDDDIIVIDVGFGFSNPDTPGINYTLPNTAYLEANKHKIRAVVITHGHMDHVGGIPYLIDRLGNPPIYTREFGAMFIQKRMEEFPHVPKLKIVNVDEHDGYLPISKDLKVKFFGLTHSIPDSTGVIIQTPLGGIVSTGDVRVENNEGVVKQEEVDQYAMFKDENILLMTMDSTGIIHPGWSISEDVVEENIDKIIKDAPGRLFIAAFSSQVERLMAFMESAKKHNKHIAVEGRSMKANLGIAEHLKLTDFSHVIPINDIDEYPPHKVIVLITGAQGEEFAALNRIANKTHKNIRIQATDTIVLSASVVPGNEHSVGKLKDNLYRVNDNLITYRDNQVHASGHGKREELRWIHTQVPYKFFMPIHGYHHMLKQHAKFAFQLGTPMENIVVPDNGSIIEIRDNGNKIVKLKEKAPSDMVVVDGNMVGVIPEVVMRDRKRLSSDGMFVVVVSIDTKTGKLRKSPDLISRGFIYLRENQKLLSAARTLIKKTVEKETMKKKTVNFDGVKDIVNDTVSKFLFKNTGKEPIVIPVVLGV